MVFLNLTNLEPVINSFSTKAVELYYPSMDDVYPVFGINPEEITTLESYLQEYYSRIMKKLKEIEYEQAKLGKTTSKNKPFFNIALQRMSILTSGFLNVKVSRCLLFIVLIDV